MYRSSVQSFGDKSDGPDYLYYNADIINNTTDDQANGIAIRDPSVRFNETRDAALIKNASDYYFSIVRFTMNGPNKDLPLFIPAIQSGTGQDDVNLTTYSASLSYNQRWSLQGVTSDVDFAITPIQRFVLFEPETKNPDLAPLPNVPAATTYRGLYNAVATYQIGDIVTLAIDALYSTGVPPYFQVIAGPQWNSSSAFAAGSWVTYGGVGYTCIAPVAFNPLATNPPPPSAPGSWVVGVTGIPTTNTAIWNVCLTTLGQPQDLSSRYYWVYTYQHWLDLVNKTLLDPANLAFSSVAPRNSPTCVACDLYYAFADAWAAVPGNLSVFPYATLQDFVDVVNIPQIIYNSDSNKFSIYGDSDGFGQRLTTFTPAAPIPGTTATATIAPTFRLFFNSNMYGLFTNFVNDYWNVSTSIAGDNLFNGLPTTAYLWNAAASYSPAQTVSYLGNGYVPIVPATTPGNDPLTNAPVEWATATTTRPVPSGYVNEMLFPNKFYQNVADFRVAPYAGAPPGGYVPTGQQAVYWISEQEQPSDDSLWSPISSIVFTSTLLPVKTEATGPPVALGEGNLGFSSATAPSAFQPIITDISLDTSSGGSGVYRSFIYYAPQAEYRLSDFGASKQDIRNIDIQVYWKNRLNSLLYPVTMFNLSSVSLKVMFKHKDART